MKNSEIIKAIIELKTSYESKISSYINPDARKSCEIRQDFLQRLLNNLSSYNDNLEAKILVDMIDKSH